MPRAGRAECGAEGRGLGGGGSRASEGGDNEPCELRGDAAITCGGKNDGVGSGSGRNYSRAGWAGAVGQSRHVCSWCNELAKLLIRSGRELRPTRCCRLFHRPSVRDNESDEGFIPDAEPTSSSARSWPTRRPGRGARRLSAISQLARRSFRVPLHGTFEGFDECDGRRRDADCRQQVTGTRRDGGKLVERTMRKQKWGFSSAGCDGEMVAAGTAKCAGGAKRLFR